MSYSTEHLLYLREDPTLADILASVAHGQIAQAKDEFKTHSRHHLGDLLDKGIDIFTARGLTSELDIQGLENIPREGPIVLVFAPHTGTLEVPAINLAMDKVKRPPVWMTKIETLGVLPSFFAERQIIPLVRDLGIEGLKLTIRLLENGAVVATAHEGTRGRGDVLERQRLQPAKGGTVLTAIRGNAPIVPVAIWGPEAERLFPFPEELVKKIGYDGLALAFFKAWVFGINKPSIHLRFAKPYTDHLKENQPQFSSRSGLFRYHAHRIMLEHIIPNLPPGWDRGFYKAKTIETLMQSLTA